MLRMSVRAAAELDTLLGSSQGFLFGAWVASSEKHGTTAAEKELMRWNAKTQVTFWEYPQPDPEDLGGVMRPSNLQVHRHSTSLSLSLCFGANCGALICMLTRELFYDATVVQRCRTMPASSGLALFAPTTDRAGSCLSTRRWHSSPCQPGNLSTSRRSTLHPTNGLTSGKLTTHRTLRRSLRAMRLPCRRRWRQSTRH